MGMMALRKDKDNSSWIAIAPLHSERRFLDPMAAPVLGREVGHRVTRLSEQSLAMCASARSWPMPLLGPGMHNRSPHHRIPERQHTSKFLAPARGIAS